jgi:hypothetical protein
MANGALPGTEFAIHPLSQLPNRTKRTTLVRKVQFGTGMTPTRFLTSRTDSLLPPGLGASRTALPR